MLLSLAAAVTWGVSDFTGGLQSRRLSLRAVLAVVYPIGLVAMLGVVAIRSQPPPSSAFVPYGVAAGVLGVGGIAALYRGLTIGQMGSVAPITATGPVIPVIYGLLQGEQPKLLQVVGMVLAVVGAVLVGRERGEDNRQRRPVSGAGLAFVAALCFGCSLIALDKASTADPYWATMVIRGASTLTVGTVLVVRRGKIYVPRRSLFPLAMVALLDLAGTVFFAIATTRGLLSIVAAIGACAPVVVILLARFVLRERLQRLQIAGVITALMGVVFVSLR